jgi:hypothetical protein
MVVGFPKESGVVSVAIEPAALLCTDDSVVSV